MELKPIDLMNRKFGRKVRGYDTSEVDEFLHAAAADFEQALAENADLRDRVEKLEAEVSRYKGMESTLNNALVLAQKTADETKSAAEKEADLIKREARDEIARELRKTQQDLEDLQKAKGRFTAEFRALLRSYLEICESGDGGRTKQPSGD